jgi:hypothetical protein
MGCTCEDDPAPPAPIVINSGQTAGAQADFNQEAAEKQRALNMINQYTPQGSSVFAPTGEEIDGIEQFGVTQSYSPEQQNLFDSQNRMKQGYADFGESQLGNVQDTYSTPFDYGQFGDAPTLDADSRATARANIIARNQSQMDRDRAARETSLANQGFTVGSEAYDSAIDSIDRQNNDFYLAADAAAGGEMAQRYGLDVNARNRAINEAINQRNMPMSEMSTFMSGSQPVNPSFLSTPQGSIAAPNYAGMEAANASARNASSMNAYNQQQAGNRASTQGLYGLLGAGVGGAASSYGGDDGWTFSDRRLKNHIIQVGELASGLAVYSFNYIWDGGTTIVGVMADEVAKLFPKAVRYTDSGFAQVNYSEIS